MPRSGAIEAGTILATSAQSRRPVAAARAALSGTSIAFCRAAASFDDPRLAMYSAMLKSKRDGGKKVPGLLGLVLK